MLSASLGSGGPVPSASQTCVLLMTVGDSGDRHSWENRIQLQKQLRDQAARDTDTLFACGGTAFPAPTGNVTSLYTPSLFHHLLHWSHGFCTSLIFPTMFQPLKHPGEVLASGSVPGQTQAWGEGGRDSGRILLKYVQRVL